MSCARSHLHECAAGTQSAEAQTWVARPPELAHRAALGDFGPDVLAWLADGLRRHVVDGYALDVALRLDRASRLRVRNDALRRAAELLAIGDARPWTVAHRLLQAVERNRRLRGAPATPLERAVAEACAATAGLPRGMPTTEQGMYDVIVG